MMQLFALAIVGAFAIGVCTTLLGMLCWLICRLTSGPQDPDA